MKIKITAWVEGEYIHSEIVFSGKTLEDLLKQVCIKDGRTLCELIMGKDQQLDKKYMIKINNTRLGNQAFDVPLQPEDHVVITNLFRFGAGG